VRDIGALIQSSISRKVQIRLELASDLPSIEADAGKLQQVIMNLIINGAEALGENVGVVVCTTALQTLDEAYIQNMGSEGRYIAQGQYVMLEVHDNGCGMDESTLPRIFEPFFTTKFTGRGLGLAAVSGIVHGHKGAMRVYSSPGRGSTFKVLFPALSGTNPSMLEPPHRLSEGRDKMVLIVDDEESVRSVARNTLQRRGYRTIEAADGREALEVYSRFFSDVSLVLLDLTMPYMNGEEVLRELKTITPSVKVLLSSGFNEVEAIRRFTGKGLAGFLQKPYSAAMLAETIKRILSDEP
jgi:two-component system cell cycle sensor histidine kinase/response regulator CckA